MSSLAIIVIIVLLAAFIYMWAKCQSLQKEVHSKENKENLKTKKNGGFSDHVYQKATDFNFFTDFQLIFQVDRITNCIYQLKEKRL